jgi:hypothetical protein
MKKKVSYETLFYAKNVSRFETDDLFYIETQLEQVNTYVDDDDDIIDKQTGSSPIPISRNHKRSDIDSNEEVKVWFNKCKLK